ncbi:MAG: hypothetical protein JRH11_14220 [Deltaproteobacteria bacterium]|nr:hypothetical protein [Deltaproteobacteria bacterium]
MNTRTPGAAADAERRTPIRLQPWMVAAALCVSTVGCSRLQPIPTNVTATHAHDAQVVRAAVIRALAHQRFDPEQEVPGQMLASVSHRKWMIRVAVDYAPWRFGIHYVDSSGLRHRVDREGRHLIHRRYHRVVEDLRRQIHRELGPSSPAPLAPVPGLGTTTTVTTTTTTATPATPVSVRVTQDVVLELPAYQKPQ